MSGKIISSVAELRQKLLGPEIKTYFFEWHPRSPIKIGKTKDIEDRLRTLQSGCPYDIRCAGWIPADVERNVHCAFRDLWLRGEWFKRSPELIEYIRDYCYRYPIPFEIESLNDCFAR